MLSNEDEAMRMCEYVIDELLPKMDPKNVLNTCELVLPVIRILKQHGQEERMRNLFGEHVVQNFHKHFGKDGVTPCLPVFRPLLLLLGVCSDSQESPDLVDGVEWLVSDEENGIPPDFLDSVWTKVCWSPNSLVAELCLRLAKKVNSQQDKVVLLKKAIKLSTKADKKMKDVEGAIKFRIAYEMHEPIFHEIKQMAETYGIGMYSGSLSSLSDKKSTLVDPRKLPKSYLRHRISSGKSTKGSTSSRSDSPERAKDQFLRHSSGFLSSSGRLSSGELMKSVYEEAESDHQYDLSLTLEKHDGDSQPVG
jgi:hypothetical protein